MNKITKCICGSDDVIERKNGDVRCKKCGVMLVWKYSVDSFHILKQEMTIDDVKKEIEDCIYNAACIIEVLGHMGFYNGNGHHAAQDVAQFAVERFMEGISNGEGREKKTN